MKRTLVWLAFTLVAVLGARADLLYFMTDAYDSTGWKNFDFAMVGVAKSGDVNWSGSAKTYLNLYSSSEATTSLGTMIGSDEARYSATAWADLTGYTDPAAGYTFYIETYESGSSTPLWGYSADTAQSYEQLVAANHVYIPGSTAPNNITAWSVPEPSGGLLLLVGFAALALRRR